jgi:hypothetical protein
VLSFLATKNPFQKGIERIRKIKNNHNKMQPIPFNKDWL